MFATELMVLCQQLSWMMLLGGRVFTVTLLTTTQASTSSVEAPQAGSPAVKETQICAMLG